jgi:hypothetical protein
MASTSFPKMDEKKGPSVEHLEYVESRKTLTNLEKTDSSSSTLSHEEDLHRTEPPTTAKDLVSEILLAQDDPTQNPWTFRTWFIGMALATLAS